MANKVKFGSSDLSVSRISFGGNVFGWTVDEKQSFRLLDSFIDAGFNFIDTADVYSRWKDGNSGGESETIIGNWISKRGKRDDLVIATKLGSDMGDGKKGLSAGYMKKAVEASLIRLGVDYIDLYISHYDDPSTTVEETMTEFSQLKAEGKIRAIGASNVSAERIKASNEFARANGLSGYVSVQPLYNLYNRKVFEQEYLPLIEAENLAATPYYALASGFLTGKYRSAEDFSKSPRGGSMEKYLNERGKKILAAMDLIALETGAALAQIAIAWQLQQPGVTAPIASATSLVQLNELLKAAELQLTAAQMKALNDASAE